MKIKDNTVADFGLPLEKVREGIKDIVFVLLKKYNNTEAAYIQILQKVRDWLDFGDVEAGEIEITEMIDNYYTEYFNNDYDIGRNHYGYNI